MQFCLFGLAPRSSQGILVLDTHTSRPSKISAYWAVVSVLRVRQLSSRDYWRREIASGKAWSLQFNVRPPAVPSVISSLRVASVLRTRPHLYAAALSAVSEKSLSHVY